MCAGCIELSSSICTYVYIVHSNTQSCLVMEPAGRLTCEELLDHSYFDDDFKEKFEPELEVCIVFICSRAV